MTTEHDAQWTENISKLPDSRNLISLPKDGKIYASTRKVLPWTPGQDANGGIDPG